MGNHFWFLVHKSFKIAENLNLAYKRVCFHCTIILSNSQVQQLRTTAKWTSAVLAPVEKEMTPKPFVSGGLSNLAPLTKSSGTTSFLGTTPSRGMQGRRWPSSKQFYQGWRIELKTMSWGNLAGWIRKWHFMSYKLQGLIFKWPYFHEFVALLHFK